MFRGDHPDLLRTVRRAMSMARDLGHPRAGSEHLLLALSAEGGAVSVVLGRHGADEAAVRQAVRRVGPRGAGAAADREILAALGLDAHRLLSTVRPAVLDRPTTREPLLPVGVARARQRSAGLSPPLGLDAQAAYEASLRLALARRDREHRPDHLALTLVALDPAAAWILSAARVDVPVLLDDLANAFPPPNRHLLLRAERKIGQRSRSRGLVRRYQRTTGRTATSGHAVAALITG